MKKIFLVLCAVVLAGCVSAKIPTYLKDNVPYKKNFYAGYDETLAAVEQTIADLGWKVASKSDPTIYEAQVVTDDINRQEILIFTEIRQMPFMLGTRYSKMNIFVRRLSETTEIEIRYVTITSTLFKSFESYKHDAAVARVFEHIEGLLKTSQ